MMCKYLLKLNSLFSYNKCPFFVKKNVELCTLLQSQAQHPY